MVSSTAFHSSPHLCDSFSDPSTVLLLAQAQYHEPFPFLGEFNKKKIGLDCSSFSLYRSSAHLFPISPVLMCHLASRVSLPLIQLLFTSQTAIVVTPTNLHAITCTILLVASCITPSQAAPIFSLVVQVVYFTL